MTIALLLGLPIAAGFAYALWLCGELGLGPQWRLPRRRPSPQLAPDEPIEPPRGRRAG